MYDAVDNKKDNKMNLYNNLPYIFSSEAGKKILNEKTSTIIQKMIEHEKNLIYTNIGLLQYDYTNFVSILNGLLSLKPDVRYFHSFEKIISSFMTTMPTMSTMPRDINNEIMKFANFQAFTYCRNKNDSYNNIFDIKSMKQIDEIKKCNELKKEIDEMRKYNKDFDYPILVEQDHKYELEESSKNVIITTRGAISDIEKLPNDKFIIVSSDYETFIQKQKNILWNRLFIFHSYNYETFHVPEIILKVKAKYNWLVYFQTKPKLNCILQKLQSANMINDIKINIGLNRIFEILPEIYEYHVVDNQSSCFNINHLIKYKIGTKPHNFQHVSNIMFLLFSHTKVNLVNQDLLYETLQFIRYYEHIINKKICIFCIKTYEQKEPNIKIICTQCKTKYGIKDINCSPIFKHIYKLYKNTYIYSRCDCSYQRQRTKEIKEVLSALEPYVS